MTFEELLRSGKLKRKSKDILVDLIYHHNHYRIPLHLAAFGKPRPLDQRPEITDDPNTFIRVYLEDEYDARFIGNDGFMYQRYMLTQLTTVSPIALPQLTAPFKVHDLIPYLNERYGVAFEEEDLVNDEYTEVPTVLTLRACSDSLVWAGDFQLNLQDNSEGAIALSSVIFDTHLNLFDGDFTDRCNSGMCPVTPTIV